jgi:DNA polymerase-3 subunit delta
MTVKPWELPAWVRKQASDMGLSLDAAAARALVHQVGERQQRLLRELERLALECDVEPGGPARTVQAADIERTAARSSQSRAYSLADALVGANAREAISTYLSLREQGEQLSGLIYLMAQRLRDALEIALRLQAGEPLAKVKGSLRMPARAAERFLSDIAATEPDRMREALATLADLELDARGGAPVRDGRSALAALTEETLALRAIGRMTAQT